MVAHPSHLRAFRPSRAATALAALRRGKSAVAAAVLALAGGCATNPGDGAGRELSAEQQATALQARSLQAPELHHFLAENLQRDPGAAWDFEAFCWVAFHYHPALQVARAQWAVTRAAQRTAAQRPNPTVTLTPGYDFTHEAGVSPWMPSIGFDFLVPTRGKRQRQQEIAAAEADGARLAVYSTVWQVRSELRKALADARLAQRRADVLGRQAAAQEKLLHLLEQRFRAGALAQADVLVTRGAWLRAQAAAADAAAQAEAARSRVAAALGLPVEALTGVELPAVPPAPALASAELATAKRAALTARADVLTALACYRSANAALALELAKKFPDIHLGPGYQYDQGLNKWTLGLTFELPVFNHNEGPIAEAAARRTEAAAQFTLVQAQALAAIEAAEAATRAAHAQSERARALQAQTRDQRQLIDQRLAAGGADEVEVETAEIDETATESSLLDAEAATAAADGQLEDALQVPFPRLTALANLRQPQPTINHE